MDTNYGTTHRNIFYASGTILFYFAPNWASVSQGGTGPGETACFIGGGDWSSNSANGLFTIYADADGSNLYFGGVGDGDSETYASAPISWSSNTWHQIGVEYTRDDCEIYLDGALAATGDGVMYVPARSTWSNGFYIGSENAGYEQARGAVWNMSTWGQEYGAWYTNGWSEFSNAIVAWQGALETSGFGGMMTMGMSSGFGAMLRMGAGMAMEADPGYLDGATYTTNYADYTNFWLAIGTPGSASQLTIQNTQSNLTYQTLTNSVLDPNLADWGVWQTSLASNSVIVCPPLNPGPNALFFDAALVWSTTTNGLPDWWQMEYFGNLLEPTNGDFDGDGITDLQAYTNGADPNVIAFTISCTNQYVNVVNVPLSLGIQRGVPYNWAVTLDNTNFGAAGWTPYTTSNITANLGTAEGWHTVWVGLRGLPANAQQTWNAVSVNLDLTPPLLVITNPAVSTVSVPVIQLQGFCPEPLSSISYDLTNATGLVTNQQVLVVDQYYDTTTWSFTTNSFQAFDVSLTNGLNTFTLHATDLAGNVTAANFSLTLDYSSKTNPPAVQIIWPADGSLVSGASFTCRGWVSDPTATVTTSAVDANGNTNLYTGPVGRDGNFWLQNIPLNAGTTVFAISVTDVLGSNTVTNINITQSALQLTVYPLDPDSQLWQPTVELYGVISDPTCSVWVNGVEATCDVYGDWCAEAVPVNVNGAANFDVTAFATGQTAPSGAISFVQPKPIRVYVASYSETSSYSYQTRYTNFPTPGTWWNWTGSGTKTINWTDGASGVQNESNYVQLICFASDLNYTNMTSALTYWPVSSWPNIPYGACLDYYTDVYATETTNGTSAYTDIVPPIVFEHCSILVPSPDESGTYIYGSSSVTASAKGSRHDQPTIKMQTGGPPGSTNLNLFVISTTATNMPIIEAPPPDWDQVNGPPTPIWPTNIMIGSLGYLGADGKLYVVLPDNTQVDITPTVPGLPYITFGETNGNPVSATKYIPVISANGIALDPNIANPNAAFSVGQQLTFTWNWSQSAPPGIQGSTTTWGFNGDFVNSYHQPAIGSPIYTNDPSFLTNQNVSAWWTSGGRTGTGIVYTASLTNILIFTNGSPPMTNTGQGRFTMYRPDIYYYSNVFYSTSETDIGALVFTNTRFRIDGTNVTISRTNITLGTIPDPEFTAYIHSAFDGCDGITQLLKGYITNSSGGVQTSNTYEADNDEFYLSMRARSGFTNVYAGGQGTSSNNLASFEDVPAINCNGNTAIHLDFVDYIRFRPNAGISNLFVTLGIVNWHVYATAGLSNGIYVLTATPDAHIDATFTDSQIFPQFTNTARNIH